MPGDNFFSPYRKNHFSEIIKEMIYGNKVPATHIKKIDLKIWLLRDEVESVIKKDVELDPENAKSIVEKYRSHYVQSLTDSNVLSFKQKKRLEEKIDKESVRSENFILGRKQQHLKIPENKIHQGSLILSEIDVDQMFFFCNRQYMGGQSIVIEFIIPNMFTLNAEILSGKPYDMKGRIISDKKLPYRTHVKFIFFDDKEKILLERFINSIEIRIETERPSDKEASDNENQEKE